MKLLKTQALFSALKDALTWASTPATTRKLSCNPVFLRERCLIFSLLATMCPPAHAHGDFGALFIFFGIAVLILGACLVLGIAILVGRLRKTKHAEIAHRATADAPKSPWWYWPVLVVLSIAAVASGLKGIALGSAFARGVGFQQPLLQTLWTVFQVLTPLIALVGVASLRRWGWWAAIALFVASLIGVALAVYRVSGSPSGLSINLWWLVFLLPTLVLGTLLLPSVRAHFFATPPGVSARVLRKEKSQTLAPESSKHGVPGNWADTVPGPVQKTGNTAAAISRRLIPNEVTAAATAKSKGLRVGDLWFGGMVMLASFGFVTWLFAWPWLRVQLEEHAARRMAANEQQVITQAREIAAQEAHPPQVSQPNRFVQPGNLNGISRADFPRIALNFPSDLGAAGNPHCWIGLFPSNASASSQSSIAIWRSKGETHFLMYMQDGETHWYGRAIQGGVPELPARLGGESPSVPFKVRFQLWDGPPVGSSQQRDMEIEFTSRPTSLRESQRWQFSVKTSMKSMASMQGREECEYPAAIAYLSFAPKFYLAGY
jgi:hypothetical protein